MSESAVPTRVQYADGQFLRAADLKADQAYHREARWRHNLALHSWGILAGLDVKVDTLGNAVQIAVGEGMALDGYGRELVVPGGVSDRRVLDKTRSYDVWLAYHEGPENGPAARPRRGCAPSTGATRLAEEPRLLFTDTAARGSNDPSRPDTVLVGDLDFGPERPAAPPDRPWPVFLARLDYRAEGAGAKAWLPDPSERRYAGLVAERVLAPAARDAENKPRSRTLIVNGSDPDYPDLRFAVASADPSGAVDLAQSPPHLAIRTLPLDPKAEPKLPPRAQIELRAERVTVAGDLTLRDGAALQFEANPIPLGEADVPAGLLRGSDHWRIYHHFTPPPVPKFEPDPKPPTPARPGYSDELRITMPSKPAGANSVVFGSFGDKGKFEPVLAVRDDRTVEVYGTLRVMGQIFGRQALLPAAAATVAIVTPSDRIATQIASFLFEIPGGLSTIVEIINLRKGGSNAIADSAITAIGKSAAGDGAKYFATQLLEHRDELKALIESLLPITPQAPPPDDKTKRDAAEKALAKTYLPLANILLDSDALRARALVGSILDSDRLAGKQVVASALGNGLPTTEIDLQTKIEESRLYQLFECLNPKVPEDTMTTDPPWIEDFKQLRQTIEKRGPEVANFVPPDPHGGSPS